MFYGGAAVSRVRRFLENILKKALMILVHPKKNSSVAADVVTEEYLKKIFCGKRMNFSGTAKFSSVVDEFLLFWVIFLPSKRYDFL
jgi:hypothetical protein